MTARLTGRCLCGAVTMTVTPSATEHGVSACHCRMCQRWTGAAFMGFLAESSDVTVAGPVTTYDSSSFAERAFCPTCGTHLWFRDHDGPYELPPGLFDGARDLPLIREVYADRAMACFRFAGDHPRVSAATYEATNLFVEGDDA